MGLLSRPGALSLVVLVTFAALLSAGTASAQGRIMILPDPRVAEGVREQVSDALSEFNQVGVDSYVQAANAKSLDPLSDEAFSRALPRDQVDVAVILVPARRVLTMVLRSGRDGSVLSKHPLRPRRGSLRRRALKTIPRFVREAMAELPPASVGRGAGASNEEYASDVLEEAPASVEDDDVVADTPAVEDDIVEDDEEQDNLGEELSEAEDDFDAAPDSDSAQDEQERRLLRLHVDLGTGLASRTLEFPIEAGAGSLAVGPSAAFDIGMEAAYTPPSAISWGIQLRYQTTVGARVDGQPIGGVERPMGIRSARFEALFVPTLELSEVVRLKLGLGYGLRGLRTDVHEQNSPTEHDLQIPSYTLAGPVARLTLVLALGDSVALSLAPEAQLLVSVGSDLTRRGVGGGGFAFGGVASLVVRMSQLLSVYAALRQAQALVAGGSGRTDVTDGERYITAGLRGAL